MKLVATLSIGAAAGAIATVAMSAVMLGAKRAGFSGELPPERITRTAIDRLTARPLDDHTEHTIASVTHLGFGAVAGALFNLLMAREGSARGSPLVAASAGVIYATCVWLVSYQGWVPGLGFMPPASRDRRGRVATMLVAHWVYGGTLGILATRIGAAV